MKKIKLKGKLFLNKEILSNLNKEKMDEVNGGITILRTRAGGACETNDKSCFRRCGSWFNC